MANLKVEALFPSSGFFEGQDSTPKYYKGAVAKGTLKKGPGNKWSYNGKTYVKKGKILYCGLSSWVNVEDKDIERIILQDNL